MSPRSCQFTRRSFLLAGAAGAAAFVCTKRPQPPHTSPFPGGIVGGNSALGHLVRDDEAPFRPPTETEPVDVVIVGGGVGGLAAARRFWQQGERDFVLLELEAGVGGNALSSANEVSAFPWGAHYLPLPGPELPEIRRLLEELGVIAGDRAGRPVYREEFLCADPMERLFFQGRWQEGMLPLTGVHPRDLRQYDAFFTDVKRWRNTRGADGHPAFTLPLDDSSTDPEIRRLDTGTMAAYLRDQGWDSPTLRWYVDYCCRDDYGAGANQVSAWAGLHYFASRTGEADNAAPHEVLTWPEGNGWLVRQMSAPFAHHLQPSCAAWNIEPHPDSVIVDAFEAATRRSRRFRARAVVIAAPRFVARKILQPWRDQPPAFPGLTYSPWMVANLTLDGLPDSPDQPPAWDNVIYGSPSLGYVTATHQHLHPVPRATVLTYYRTLHRRPPHEARALSLTASHADWCRQIVSDLETAHPDIAHQIRRLDVWFWGHAMVRPVPGYLWGDTRRRLLEPLHRVAFAHSDMSGIAIFEEAYLRGLRAADHLLESVL